MLSFQRFGARVGVYVVVASLAAALTGCDEKVNATATCEKIERFHSNLGVVNVPLYALGKVIVLDASSKRAQGMLSLAPTEADVAAGSAAETMTVKLDSSFSVAFDAKVPAVVEAQASTALSDATSAVLTNVARSDLSNPLAFANASKDLKNQLKAFANDATKHVVLVSSLKKASTLELGLSDGVEGKVSANVLKFGEYEITVKYSCAGLVRLTGDQAKNGVFFGVTPLKYDASTDSVVMDDAPVDVWEYDLSQTLTGG